MACSLHIGMNHNSGEILCFYFVAPVFEPDIAETEEIIFGFICMLLAIADENSLSLCASEIFGVEITLCINFSITRNSIREC